MGKTIPPYPEAVFDAIVLKVICLSPTQKTREMSGRLSEHVRMYGFMLYLIVYLDLTEKIV